MNAAAAPLSLCIVTNRPDDRLEEIICAASGKVAEILIGYDGDPQNLPARLGKYPGCRIIPLSWEGYGATKNKLAAAAACDWIWSLDSDEVPDDALLTGITGLPLDRLPDNKIFTFKRLSFFEGKKIQHGAWGRDKVRRLYNRRHTRWNNDAVHEALIIHETAVLTLLQGTLLHYTADDYTTFLQKNERYARLSAEKYFEKGKRSPWWKRRCSPAFTFIREYIFQGGFLDGRAGFRIAQINAQYTRWKYAFLRQKYQESAN